MKRPLDEGEGGVLSPRVADGTTVKSGSSVARRFEPTWESLRSHRTPAWFQDAKFGIWAHWGPQSVPMMGDWYARHLYGVYEGTEGFERERAARVTRFHRWRYGHPSRVGHKDICHLWKAQRWEPEDLMHLYRRAGARYFVSMGAHCDNFDLWDSKYQEWNSVKVGPRTNVVGRWERAARSEGLRFGVSAHFGSWTWRWLNAAFARDTEGPLQGLPYDGHLQKSDGAGTWWDGLDPAQLYGPVRRPGDPPTAAFVDNFYLRLRDLVEQHEPDIVYLDDARLPFSEGSVCPGPGHENAGLSFLAWYYNQASRWDRADSTGVVTIKEVPEADRQAVMLDVERRIPDDAQRHPWQNCACLGEWFYKLGLRWASAAQVVHRLVDVVSKNGNLLLSVPQRPDGTIDSEERAVLEAVGRWLDRNGEAIFGTCPWVVAGEGPTTSSPFSVVGEAPVVHGAADIRFTTREEVLYATVLGWPAGGRVAVKALAAGSRHYVAEVGSIQLLGVPGNLAWERDTRALWVTLPPVSTDEPAYVIRIHPARGAA